MQTFIEFGDKPLADQVVTFCEKIVPLQDTLGLDKTKVADLTAAGGFFVFELKQIDLADQYMRSHTSYKNQLRYGKDKMVLGALPTAPVYPADAPMPVQGNVQDLFANITQDCVRSKAFTEAMGLELGIIKPKEAFEPEAGTPKLSGNTAKGGHPLLHAKVGKYQGFEIWKDYGDGQGYKLFGTAMQPDFMDNSALPAHGANTSWKYKAIYIYKGQHAGSWSNEIIITVSGAV